MGSDTWGNVRANPEQSPRPSSGCRSARSPADPPVSGAAGAGGPDTYEGREDSGASPPSPPRAPRIPAPRTSLHGAPAPPAPPGPEVPPRAGTTLSSPLIGCGGRQLPGGGASRGRAASQARTSRGARAPRAGVFGHQPPQGGPSPFYFHSSSPTVPTCFLPFDSSQKRSFQDPPLPPRPRPGPSRGCCGLRSEPAAERTPSPGNETATGYVHRPRALASASCSGPESRAPIRPELPQRIAGLTCLSRWGRTGVGAGRVAPNVPHTLLRGASPRAPARPPLRPARGRSSPRTDASTCFPSAVLRKAARRDPAVACREGARSLKRKTPRRGGREPTGGCHHDGCTVMLPERGRLTSPTASVGSLVSKEQEKHFIRAMRWTGARPAAE